jgi:SagB-type dehydrogenase family enzyme
VHHEVGQLGPFVLKTSPSGGGRHPIEVYPLVLRVDGLSPGIYHYRVETDTLGLLSSDVDDALAARLVASQDWISDAAVVFLMTAVLERSMWKYKHAHAFRVVLMDAGHLGQTFHLVCTALGLAPFTSAANDAAAVENLLGIDGIDEVVVYTAATGWPVRSAHHRAGRS